MRIRSVVRIVSCQEVLRRTCPLRHYLKVCLKSPILLVGQVVILAIGKKKKKMFRTSMSKLGKFSPS